MDRRAVMLAGAGAATLAALPAAGEDDGPRKVVEAFHKALAAGDLDGAVRRLHIGVTVYEQGGVERSAREYVNHHLRADMEFAQATRREVSNFVSGRSDDLAWEACETRTTGTFKDKPVDVRGTETMILRRGDDGWRIHHIHWSSRKA